MDESSPAEETVRAPERIDLRIVSAMRCIMQAVGIHSRQLKARFNVTVPQLLCLTVVVEDSTLSVAALARRVHLRPSTVVGIVDRLEKQNLVRRERDQRDRRVVHVVATEEGARVVAMAPSPLQARFLEALQGLPELEQIAIALSLERVVALMGADGLQETGDPVLVEEEDAVLADEEFAGEPLPPLPSEEK